VTIVTQRRGCFFGDGADGNVRLNEAGQMLQLLWNDLSLRYPNVETDASVVMPNHIHGIVLVGAGPRACPSTTDSHSHHKQGQPQGVAPTLSLPDVVHRFKTLITKRYVDGVKQFGWASFAGNLWQRNYYEHIIRNDESLYRIRHYIQDSPSRWDFDHENPAATNPEPENALRTQITQAAVPQTSACNIWR
jgi:putative transposase